VPGPGPLDPRTVRATAVAHQEGVIGLLSLIGLSLTEGGAVAGLQPAGSWMVAVGVGIVVGVPLAGVMWLLRSVPALAELEAWQRRMVAGWKVTDALAVALLSGLAEEALMRALLQPIVGLAGAAALFALLHVVPDKRLWPWPVMAFGMGLVFGLLFNRWGYPAAAAAHAAVNAVGLVRLQR
jgi:membrane protease YdiL (CAAX protease family)